MELYVIIRTGIPILFVLRKIRGACFSRAIPYRVREDPRRLEFPALHAEVRTTKLIIEGITLMPALCAAITKGDSDAVPLLFKRFGSFDGTSIPTKKMLKTIDITWLAVKLCSKVLAHRFHIVI